MTLGPNFERLIDEIIARRAAGDLPPRSDAALAALANAEFAVQRDPVRIEIEDAAAHVESRRTWAAFMLARHVDTGESILLGLPVMAGRLDGEVLRRALRGGPLPDASAFIEVTPEMLDAIAEAGPLPPTTKKGGKR